jgi:colanic acid biosynthesis protein WcaH
LFLSNKQFKLVVASTPLVSIDLIVKNKLGEVLLGLRRNRPAKDYWFVPGGRIQKNESFEIAFRRIACSEIGIESNISNANFIGVYEHFYSESVCSDDVSTHYVVLAYEVIIRDLFMLPLEQHVSYAWYTIDALMEHAKVHKNTKNYFT